MSSSPPAEQGNALGRPQQARRTSTSSGSSSTNGQSPATYLSSDHSTRGTSVASSSSSSSHRKLPTSTFLPAHTPPPPPAQPIPQPRPAVSPAARARISAAATRRRAEGEAVRAAVARGTINPNSYNLSYVQQVMQEAANKVKVGERAAVVGGKRERKRKPSQSTPTSGRVGKVEDYQMDEIDLDDMLEWRKKLKKRIKGKE